MSFGKSDHAKLSRNASGDMEAKRKLFNDRMAAQEMTEKQERDHNRKLYHDDVQEKARLQKEAEKKKLEEKKAALKARHNRPKTTNDRPIWRH